MSCLSGWVLWVSLFPLACVSSASSACAAPEGAKLVYDSATKTLCCKIPRYGGTLIIVK